MKINQTTNSKDSFAELLEKSLSDCKSLECRVVTGTIVGFRNDKAIIDVGLKAEGRIFINDIKTLKGSDNIVIGDTLDVFIDRFEDKNGEPILSIEKAKKEAVWTDLERHMETNTTIEGVIMGRTRGGFSVDINGTMAFLPGSQVDLRLVKDIAPLLNIKQPFKILKMDKIRNNIVVSRRAVLEANRLEVKNEIMSKLEEGMEIEGVVKNITEYGAFVDIGGIDGLLHVTDMSWKRVNLPTDIVNVGDKVKVQILKFNMATSRISLGMKQLVTTPWENIEERYVVGNKYKGKVVNITDYGAFVELKDGIEGMIYMTELSWTKKNIHPSKVLSIGEEVEVMILEINTTKKKISLGFKQCKENPWKKFAEEHTAGTKLNGIVKNITEFGVFVGVNEELDGMVHVSDLSWGAGNADDRSKNIQQGQEIEVVVLEVNPEKERISLGIKQLEHDPHAEAIANTKKGDIVFAEVTNIQASGVEVKLKNGLTGFVKKIDISSNKAKKAPNSLKIGEEVEAVVLGIDKSRTVNLSIKNLELQREKEALEQLGESSDTGTTNLGDILEAAMSEKTTKNKK
jgi:small subunit ribosomal protein S1